MRWEQEWAESYLSKNERKRIYFIRISFKSAICYKATWSYLNVALEKQNGKNTWTNWWNLKFFFDMYLKIVIKSIFNKTMNNRFHFIEFIQQVGLFYLIVVDLLLLFMWKMIKRSEELEKTICIEKFLRIKKICWKSKMQISLIFCERRTFKSVGSANLALEVSLSVLNWKRNWSVIKWIKTSFFCVSEHTDLLDVVKCTRWHW